MKFQIQRQASPLAQVYPEGLSDLLRTSSGHPQTVQQCLRGVYGFSNLDDVTPTPESDIGYRLRALVDVVLLLSRQKILHFYPGLLCFF